MHLAQVVRKVLLLEEKFVVRLKYAKCQHTEPAQEMLAAHLSKLTTKGQ